MLVSCLNTLSGHIGVSNTISESKRRKVFICELQALPNPYIINDTLQIRVKKAWLEKHWAYKQNNDESYIQPGYQIVIDTDKKSINGIDKIWQIGNTFEESFRKASKKSIMIDLDSIPENYWFTWKVLLGRHFDTTRVIGKFELYSANHKPIQIQGEPAKPH